VPLSGYCAFYVELTVPAANEFRKLLKTADGSMTFPATGPVTATFTNLTTRKAITENASRPGKFTVNPDNSLTIFEEGRQGPGAELRNVWNPVQVTLTASAPGLHTGLVRCCGVGRSGHLTLQRSAS
jgi:hypothetical protein